MFLDLDLDLDDDDDDDVISPLKKSLTHYFYWHKSKIAFWRDARSAITVAIDHH